MPVTPEQRNKALKLTPPELTDEINLWANRAETVIDNWLLTELSLEIPYALIKHVQPFDSRVRWVELLENLRKRYSEWDIRVIADGYSPSSFIFKQKH